MQQLDKDTKFAHLGKPGSAFSKGFERRLNMITARLNLEDNQILDVGCGEGVWLQQFANFTEIQNVYGSDIDQESLDKVPHEFPRQNLKQCPAEQLDFQDNQFDIVFSNEVIEHVEDDGKTVAEMVRVTKPGGYIIIFTPNRGWPFEQHGMFLFGKYYWGNIPLLPWMPKFIYDRFAPHVRNYWHWDIKRLTKDLPVEYELHTHIFPGFDGMVRRFGAAGRIVQKLFHLLEKTPFNWFGISHFVILRKN